MIVARSFGYGTGRRRDQSRAVEAPASNDVEHQRRGQDGDDKTTRGFGWRPDAFHKFAPRNLRLEVQSESPTPRIGPSDRTPDPQTGESLESSTKTTRPIRVPSRNNSRDRSSPSPTLSESGSWSSGSTAKDATISRESRPTKPRRTSRPRLDGDGGSGNSKHDPRAMPASVAALLAITSIPRYNPSGQQSHTGRSASLRPTSALNNGTPLAAAPARQLPRRMSTQQLMQHWQNDLPRPSVSRSVDSSSSLDLLLTPPSDSDYLIVSSPLSYGSADYGLSARSLSEESMPSLAADELSTGSRLSTSFPSTPAAAAFRQNGGTGWRRARDRALSLSLSFESVSEHPLSRGKGKASTIGDIGEEDSSDLAEADESDESDSNSSLSFVASTDNDNELENGSTVVSPASSLSLPPRKAAQPVSPRPQPSRFKSNLTASLSALKQSLRSLSNFATSPYTIPDDHLTRGLFADSQRIRSEMRPRPLDRPASPELRRYLNPSKYHHSAPGSAGEFHLHASRFDHGDVTGALFSSPDAADWPGQDKGLLIALQDRVAVGHALELGPGFDGTLDASLTEAGRAAGRSDEPGMNAEQSSVVLLQQHRREVRDNPDFLRMCVLEANMRRAGKFETSAAGRARLWLPARHASSLDTVPVYRSVGDAVPRRWASRAP